jgi:hypothetical protein
MSVDEQKCYSIKVETDPNTSLISDPSANQASSNGGLGCACPRRNHFDPDIAVAVNERYL